MSRSKHGVLSTLPWGRSERPQLSRLWWKLVCRRGRGGAGKDPDEDAGRHYGHSFRDQGGQFGSMPHTMTTIELQEISMSQDQRQPLPKGTMVIVSQCCWTRSRCVGAGSSRGCAVPSCQSLYPSRSRIYKEKETKGGILQVIVSKEQSAAVGELGQPLGGSLHHQSSFNR